LVLASWCGCESALSPIPARSDLIVLDEQKTFSDPKKAANDFLREGDRAEQTSQTTKKLPKSAQAPLKLPFRTEARKRKTEEGRKL
jgi:hypothetical protein